MTISKLATVIIATVIFCVTAQNNNGGGIINPVVAPGGGFQSNSGGNGNRVSLLGPLEKLLASLIGNIHQTPGLNQNELFQLFAIIKNQNLTKSQVKTQIEQWATRQGQEIQKLYNDAKTKVSQEMTNINAEIEAKAATLTSQAKAAYDQYKSIISNDGISRREECERLEAITASLDSSIRQELFQAFGSLRMCPRSPGSNNNNNGGFINGGQQQQQNGNSNGFGNNQLNGQNTGFNNGQQGSFGGQPQNGGFGSGFNNNGFGGQQQQDNTNGNFGGQQQNGGFGNPQGNSNAEFGNTNGGFGGQQQPQNNFGNSNAGLNGQGFGGQQPQQPNNQAGQQSGSNQAPFG